MCCRSVGIRCSWKTIFRHNIRIMGDCLALKEIDEPSNLRSIICRSMILTRHRRFAVRHSTSQSSDVCLKGLDPGRQCRAARARSRPCGCHRGVRCSSSAIEICKPGHLPGGRPLLTLSRLSGSAHGCESKREREIRQQQSNKSSSSNSSQISRVAEEAQNPYKLSSRITT